MAEGIKSSEGYKEAHSILNKQWKYVRGGGKDAEPVGSQSMIGKFNNQLQ